MRKLLLIVFMTLSICPCGADTPTWKRFINEHPKCIKNDVIYKGCTLLVCSDSEYLFVQLNILHPAMQMRMLMQGLTMYIDPTGKKKEKYAIVFPSASDVQNIMYENVPSASRLHKERPDIAPLINSLQEYGVVYNVKGKASSVNKEMYSITLNEKKDMISYSLLIPIGDMLNEKKLSQTWSVGLYSEGGRRNNDGPGIEGRDMRRQSEMPMGQRGTPEDDQAEMQKIMLKDIVSWTKFSIEKACSLND